MKASEVRVGHVYNIDFEPVRKGEFDKTHLAVVVKKNKDGQTFIVVPLTSSPIGCGCNKLHIGKIDTLPQSLRDKETYAVLDQVRTVNASRFRTLKQGDCIVDVVFPLDKLPQLLHCIIGDLLSNTSREVQVDVLQTVRNQIMQANIENILYAAMKEKYSSIGIQHQERIKKDLEQFAALEFSHLRNIQDDISQFIQDTIEKY